MPSSLSENKYPKWALPMGGIKVPKFLYLIVGILVSLILVVIGFNVFLERGKNKANLSISIPKKLTNIEMAKRTMDWLDTQRDEKGMYPYSCSCTTKECASCVKNNVSWREGPFMIWGRYKYYQKTGNNNDLMKIEQELDTLIPKPMQFEDWNCRMLLDLWQYPKINDEIKQKVVELCTNDGRTSVDVAFIKNLEEMSPSLNDDDIKENIIKIMSGELLKIDNNLYDLDILKRNFPKNSFFTSENISKKIVSAKKDEIEDAKIYFHKDNIKSNFKYALYGYNLLSSTPSAYNNAILGISALDMYHYYGDQIYLELAKFLYFQNKTLEIKPNYSDLVYQSFFLMEMNKENPQKEYTDEIQKNITILTNSFFNTKINAFTVGDRLNIKENGLIVGLLML